MKIGAFGALGGGDLNAQATSLQTVTLDYNGNPYQLGGELSARGYRGNAQLGVTLQPDSPNQFRLYYDVDLGKASQKPFESNDVAVRDTLGHRSHKLGAALTRSFSNPKLPKMGIAINVGKSNASYASSLLALQTSASGFALNQYNHYDEVASQSWGNFSSLSGDVEIFSTFDNDSNKSYLFDVGVRASLTPHTLDGDMSAISWGLVVRAGGWFLKDI